MLKIGQLVAIHEKGQHWQSVTVGKVVKVFYPLMHGAYIFLKNDKGEHWVSGDNIEQARIFDTESEMFEYVESLYKHGCKKPDGKLGKYVFHNQNFKTKNHFLKKMVYKFESEFSKCDEIKMPEFQKSKIEIKDCTGKEIKFVIYHNFQPIFGHSIERTLDEWANQTKNHTARSFCKYIMDNHPTLVAMTETQLKRLNKLGA